METCRVWAHARAEKAAALLLVMQRRRGGSARLARVAWVGWVDIILLRPVNLLCQSDRPVCMVRPTGLYGLPETGQTDPADRPETRQTGDRRPETLSGRPGRQTDRRQTLQTDRADRPVTTPADRPDRQTDFGRPTEDRPGRPTDPTEDRPDRRQTRRPGDPETRQTGLFARI